MIILYDERVKKYAKQLFLSLDDYGDKIYTNNQVAQMVKDKYGKTIGLEGDDVNDITEDTIEFWADTEKDISGTSWNDIYDKTLEMRVDKAKTSLDVYFENQELVEQMKDVPKFRYTIALTFIARATEYILSEPIDSMKDAQWMYEAGLKDLDRIHYQNERGKKSKNDPYQQAVELARKRMEDQEKRIKEEARARQLEDDKDGNKQE